MRIVVIHSFYRSAVSSGENNAVLAQVEALRGAGHEVKLIAQYTDENRKRNPLYPLKAGFDVATGNGYDPTPELEKFQPDVVWVHNLFPNFSTRWLAKWRGPLIATLHNYRPVCANGVLFRDGHVCTLCPDGKPLSSFKYGCYRSSRLASTPLTIQISKGLGANPLIARADRLVVLSVRSANFFQTQGVVCEKLFLLPHFVSRKLPVKKQSWGHRGWIVASRLTSEKGVLQLVKNWPEEQQLDIFGSGPEAQEIRALQHASVKLHGTIDSDALEVRYGRYFGAVFPSQWWETFGLSVAEALVAGIPVIAAKGSAGADLVLESGAGVITNMTRQDLRGAIEQVLSERSRMSERALRFTKEFYTESSWLGKVNSLLSAVL